MDSLKSVAVFCGSRIGNDSQYRSAALELGMLLSERNIRLVYGGGSGGLMGVLADAVLEHGGSVTGVIPNGLSERELTHCHLTELFIVDSMHERKAMMEQLSQGFIALPGGIGTLEEFFEVITWAQLKFHEKPCGLLNTAEYYDGLLSFLREMERQGFLSKSFWAKLVLDDQPGALLNKMTDRFDNLGVSKNSKEG